MFSIMFEQCVVAADNRIVCYVYRTCDKTIYTISAPTVPVTLYSDLDALTAQCILNEIWSKAP